MDMLDPSRHAPVELQGKAVDIGGCTYVIGELFRDGDQGHFHQLKNVRSGLALHLVQLRRNYMSDPVRAAAASEMKVKMNMQLRTGLMESGSPVIVMPLRRLSGQASVVELHENPTFDAGLPKQAIQQLRRGQFADALVCIDPFIRDHPNNSEGIAMRARLHEKLGNLPAAVSDIGAAVAVEPNFSRYMLDQIEYALGDGDLDAAETHLAAFKLAFPGEHDADRFEIQLLLRRRNLEGAGAALRVAALPVGEIERLRAALGIQGTEQVQSGRSWWSRLTGRH